MYKLFVFLRSDLESMTPGKAAAQVAHAASQLARDAYYTGEARSEYKEWEKSANGFGTTIVLDGGSFPENDKFLGSAALPFMTLFAGDVLDPTYPLRDGLVTHLIPLHTCWWVFDDPEENANLGKLLENYGLYRGNFVGPIV